MLKIGFTIGKFAPFHKGHEFLINKGIKEMDEFYVIIYDTPELNIPIKTKESWIKSIFPTVKILYAFNSPKQYGLDENSVKIQMEYLLKIIKDIPFNYFYSSEEYGYHVAKFLNITNVVVDKKRINIPISSSKIRSNLNVYKKYLNDNVYNDLLKNTNL